MRSKRITLKKLKKSIKNHRISEPNEHDLFKNNSQKLDIFVEGLYSYVRNLIKYNKVKHFWDKRKKIPSTFRKDINKPELNKPLISFIMPIQNRVVRSLLSLHTFYQNEISDLCEFIIVENISKNTLSSKDIKEYPNLYYYKVDTEIKEWSRSMLLNYGIQKSNGKYIIPWDACFLCENIFLNKLVKYVQKSDFDKYIMTVAVYETHKTNRSNKGDGYGNLWIYETQKIKKLKGFDENFKSFGFEDRDLEIRLNGYFNTKTLHSNFIEPDLFVLHLSHKSYQIKTKVNINKNIWKEKERNKQYINHNDKWGELKLIQYHKFK